jgi:hypothetical protein
MAPGFVIDGAVRNAAASWVLVAIIAGIAAGAVLAGQALYAAFAVAVVVLAAVPPARFGPRAMLPWEVLALCALPLFARAAAVRLLTTGGAASVATYLSVAAVALVVAVELDVFTPVRMTDWFAVLFVVVATLAAAGAWAVVQWASDMLLGTTFIYPVSPAPAEVAGAGPADRLAWVGAVVTDEAELAVTPAVETAAETALMWDFVAATAAGALAAGVFEWYFRRLADGGGRLPADVWEAVERS